ncbi:complex I assembly factor ACAD9, mitochondrial [Anthonomus grandis grandis]|uniref:complex I assembly factor ACAD9, mitochondrial n=1 Tax=Anthonomus grandis grandis TaxID=2921223 RepID=UPI0021665C4E|nr:complex I assembly factor ACAD9, mitochondrial [Anthonomus grandis grandis]
MMSLNVSSNSVNRRLLTNTLRRLYATSIEPVRKEESQEHFEKELKKYDRLTNITKRTRTQKPQREPFVKNLALGIFDHEILTFPEMDLPEVRNVESEVHNISQLLSQKHMANIDTLANKSFRQNLADYRAIALTASQFLDAREACPLEVMRFLETLSEHQLGDNLMHNEMLGCQVLSEFASDGLKKKYLYPVIMGEQLTAFALSEHNMMDVMSMNTKVELSSDKKYWILNGSKSYVVNGASADFLIVFAISEVVTRDKDKETSLTAFLVEKNFPGVSWQKMEPTDIELTEFNFENVQVPTENIIGRLHYGEKILKRVIRDFRLSCGPACTTLSKSMINNLYKTLVKRASEEYDLMATDAIRSKLGETAMHHYAMESVTYLTAGLLDWYQDQDVDVESSIVKVLASEAALKISTTCLDLIGLPATMKNHWARKSHEQILNYLTLHETNDSQRMFIAVSALQHAGVHLSNRIKKLRNPLFHATYNFARMFTQHRQNSDDPKLDLNLIECLHPSLDAPSKQLEYCVKRLEFITEAILMNNGVECVNEHVELRRLADVIIDCYAMTAVIARASRAYCIGLQFADFEVILASVFCNMAIERVRDNVRNIVYDSHKANERSHKAVGKRFVESKGYFIQNPISRFF